MLDPLALSIDTSSVPGNVPSDPSLPQRKLLMPIPGAPDEYIMEMDYSTLSSFMICPRQFYNYAILGREAAIDNSATEFGGLFHRCEELRLRHGLTEAVQNDQKILVCDHFLKHATAPGDHRTADRMFEVLKMYNARYAHDAWEKAIVQIDGEPFIEKAFAIPMATYAIDNVLPFTPEQLVVMDVPNTTIHWTWPGEGPRKLKVSKLHFVFTGRIDAVISAGGCLWTMDNKTTSRGGQEFDEYFRLSLQTRGYTWATQQLVKQEVKGCIVNALVIRKPTKTGTATELDRKTYVYSQDLLDDWKDSTLSHVDHLLSCLQRGIFPQTSLSFKSPCVSCDYRYNCTLPKDQRSSDLASQTFRNVTWNPHRD